MSKSESGWGGEMGQREGGRVGQKPKLQVSAQASGLVPVGHDGAILARAATESWLSGLAVCLASKPETSPAPAAPANLN